MDTLPRTPVLWRLLALLLPCLGISGARFLSFQAIPSPGSNRISIPHLKNDSVELYKSTAIRYARHPSISEMCNYVMTKKVFMFRVGRKEFLIYPLDKVVQKKGHDQKILGYFDKIITVNNSVVMKYKNGDKSILGPLYSSTVQIQSSQRESYDARFKDTPTNILLSLSVSEPLLYDQETVLGVYRRSPGFDPVIEIVLEEQSKEGRQKRLPSSILKQLGLGMEIPDRAAKPSGDGNSVVDQASLRRIARRFKKDLEMAQRTPVSAAEYMIIKSLRTPRGTAQGEKHARREKYETRIASEGLDSEQSGLEGLSKMLSKYFHTMPFPQDSRSSTQSSVPEPKPSSEAFDAEDDEADKPQDAVDRQH